MSDTVEFDLDAYLGRIGWEGERVADAATLRAVHLAHSRAIPFENLDAVNGTAPSLEPGDLLDKLVRGRRGGYCYEQNTLLLHALEALGFGVTRLSARVQVGADGLEVRPRTHMTLLVEVAGETRPYLADVGFGAVGALLEPVPLVAGEEFEGAGRRHRLVRVSHRGPLDLWVLEAFEQGPAWEGGWRRQYAFTLDPSERPDFEVFNWFVATNPRSPFTQRLYVQRMRGDQHVLLSGRELTVTSPDGTVSKREVSEEEVPRLLDEEFGIDVPQSHQKDQTG
ncbi:arylamine N-acetyltransferase [Streptomyces sp. NBC_00140]|uniref:arylamine N-acetyltransferase family protein n=1 Tax=Streptomyces sp. NBC_00140 TaxID=2975664 RepID=UPI0022591638|nr:arylamine N-acetyltransferase [Streptomyces sp. NBC_00140]MCX5332358.1 arylamine N-acetyltransferase [Streptomyces sp. NBC_00140]